MTVTSAMVTHVSIAAFCLLSSAVCGWFRDRNKLFDILSIQFLFVALGAVLGLISEVVREVYKVGR